jgi:ribosome recycling factor
MEPEKVIEQLKVGMAGAIDFLKQELRAVRAGRANPAIVEIVMVEVYGSQMRVKELGTISTPEPRQLLITPFDINNAGAISKAIEKANLGVRVALEGKLVRVFFPELDETRRKDLVKQVHEKKEKCKGAARNVRQEANKKLKDLKGAGVSEDDIKRLEKEIQHLTDKVCKEADDLSAVKEKEIMTI